MYKQRIEEYFRTNRESLINDVCRLVRIKSDKGDAKAGMPYGEGPAAALEEALKIASEMGFATKNYDNYVGAIDFGDMEKQLDILAHLDVVPAGDGWTVTEPYEPVAKDGRIYGRGAADDKGPAIAALYAMKAVRDLNIPLKKNVRLIVGTDEECGSSDIKYYYGIEEEAPMTFSPDGEFPVINIEKGGLKGDFSASWQEDAALPRVISVKSGIKGNVIPDKAYCELEGFDESVVREITNEAAKETGINYNIEGSGTVLKVSATGKGGHASLPEGANNALTGLLHMIAMLPAAESTGFERLKGVSSVFPHQDWEGKAAGVAMSDVESGKLTISFNIFEYDTTSLKGVFDCRAPLCASNENMRDVVRDSLAAKGITLSDEDMYAPHHVPGDSEFVKVLLKCYEQYTGNEGKAIAIGGGTYVHSLKNGVAFGCSMPGTDNNMHGADEFAVIDELIVSAEIFAQVIIDLCA